MEQNTNDASRGPSERMIEAHRWLALCYFCLKSLSLSGLFRDVGILTAVQEGQVFPMCPHTSVVNSCPLVLLVRCASTH